MNRFVNPHLMVRFLGSFLVLFIALFTFAESMTAQAEQNSLDTDEIPVMQLGSSIHAGMDSEGGIIYIINDQGIWEYSIPQKSWNYRSGLEQLPEPLWEYESGFDEESKTLYFWDRGVGSVYEFDIESNTITKVDNSHPHRNQFTHQPFFKDGTIYTFGGYGYWSWKNYITYFNQNLGEWSIQEIAPDSEIPTPRIIDTGVYVPHQQEFFTYGGRAPTNALRADDTNTESVELKDLWKFSFDENTWAKVGEMDSHFEHYPNSLYQGYFTQNKITGSIYSKENNIWYIPVIDRNLNGGLSLIPVNTITSDILPAIPLENSFIEDLIPTNFLIDQNRSRIYMVGLSKIAEIEDVPIRIVDFPEDSLLIAIERVRSESQLSSYILPSLTILVLFVLIFFGVRKMKSDQDQESVEPQHLDVQNPNTYTWLREKEKDVLKELLDSKSGLDSEELEDRIWPEIESYDYRRKLRNETIRTINSKFKQRFKKKENVILREKDIQDKRRFLYKINETYTA